MPAWVIDEFKGKPSGVLASWRYKRVLVDENGIITNSGVPGEETMNDCVSSYRKDNRRKFTKDSTGKPLITDFCNRNTFTHYRVYALDCSPYAEVEVDVNSTACGYDDTPAPTTGIPVTPFGTGTYGLYRTHADCVEVTAQPMQINFYRRGFVGTPLAIPAAGRSPVQITKREPTMDEYGIQITEAVFTFIANPNFTLAEFYSFDEREFLVEVLVDGGLIFKGYLTPDSCQEDFDGVNYLISIRSNDGLGALQNITFPMPVSTKSNLRQRLLDVLSYACYMTNLDLDIVTVNNLYEQNMLTGVNDEPLAQSKVNPLRMSDGQGNIYDCYRVISELCKNFYAVFRQEKGKWYFIRINELPNEVIRSRVFDKGAAFVRGENVVPTRIAGDRTKDVVLTGGRPQISIGNAYKRVEVLLKYGDIPAIIFNGDFEMWTGTAFPFWLNVGGVDVTRIQRTAKGSGGAPIGLENYAAQFNKKADPGKYYQATPNPVYKGDKLTFGVRVGPQPKRQLHALKVRFTVGGKFLYNDPDNNPDQYEWVDTLATCTLFISDSANPIYYEISLPDIPVNGNLNIQIFGFENLKEGFTNENPVIWIDDLSIGKNSALNKGGIDGSVSVADQTGFYTNRPDPIEIIFGDYDLSFQKRRPDRVPPPTIENNMFAIYTNDGSYSKGWYEYGMSKSPVPLTLAIARGMLKSHQAPYRFLDTGLYGTNLSANDVYKIDVPSDPAFIEKKFIVISGTYDIKSREATGVRLMEILNKNIVTNDLTTPHYVSQFQVKEQLQATIDQNPNNNNQSGAGIFTDEFTQEFS